MPSPSTTSCHEDRRHCAHIREAFLIYSDVPALCVDITKTRNKPPPVQLGTSAPKLPPKHIRTITIQAEFDRAVEMLNTQSALILAATHHGSGPARLEQFVREEIIRRHDASRIAASLPNEPLNLGMMGMHGEAG